MALPYYSTASTPQGLSSVTIDGVSFVIDVMPDFDVEDSRLISRTDANGDRADFIIREGSDPRESTMTLQRELTTTVRPPAGEEFTLDFDRSGTASTIVVKSSKTNVSKDDFDTFEVPVVLVTYQA